MKAFLKTDIRIDTKAAIRFPPCLDDPNTSGNFRGDLSGQREKRVAIIENTNLTGCIKLISGNYFRMQFSAKHGKAHRKSCMTIALPIEW